MVTNRADPRTSATTDWREMTAGIRAMEALQRNFGRRDHGRVVQRDGDHARVRGDQFRDRDVAFGREVRGTPNMTPNILTGTSQRIDILSGRPID